MTTSSLRTIGRVTGVAATTAPYVRRLATDDELRDDMTDFVRSANNLIAHLRSDQRLRRDLDDVTSSVRRGAGRLRTDVSPRHHYMRNVLIGTGLIIMGIGAAIALGYPRARQGVTRVVDRTTTRANDTVRDIRERIAPRSDEQAA